MLLLLLMMMMIMMVLLLLLLLVFWVVEDWRKRRHRDVDHEARRPLFERRGDGVQRIVAQ